MRRHRRGEPDRRAVLIERPHDLASVQLQPGAAATRRRAVDRIAQDRPTHFRAMHPQLMGAAGEWFEREPAQFPSPLVGGGGGGGGSGRSCEASTPASDLPTPTPNPSPTSLHSGARKRGPDGG